MNKADGYLIHAELAQAACGPFSGSVLQVCAIVTTQNNQCIELIYRNCFNIKSKNPKNQIQD